MIKEHDMDFDTFLKTKEKRRSSRSKGKRTYDKTKLHNVKPKARNTKGFQYDFYDDEDYSEGNGWE